MSKGKAARVQSTHSHGSLPACVEGFTRLQHSVTQIIDGSTLIGAADSQAAIEQPCEDNLLSSVVTPQEDDLTIVIPDSVASADPETDLASALPEAETTVSAFAAFGLRRELLDGLAAIGFEEPSPIQKAAIPELMLGRDLVGQAQTGTGKTAAFGLPLLERLDAGQRTPRCWC